MTGYFEISLIFLWLEILETGECTSHDFVSKHNFNQSSISGVSQFQSGMAPVPISNFIGKLSIGLHIWARFLGEVLHGFGVFKLGPPNFVIEKKKNASSFYSFARQKILLPS